MFGFTTKQLWDRLHANWSLEEALVTPIRQELPKEQIAREYLEDKISLVVIGKKHGISRSRVHQIVMEWRRQQAGA
jgi:DNA-directed RNA polymerase specialized sigma subunit